MASNTYAKSPEGLMGAIPLGQAGLFQNTMDSLSPVNQSMLRYILAHLPDDQFVAIINRLRSASPGRLQYYVYILGAHDSTKDKPNQTIPDGTSYRQKCNDAGVLSAEELRTGFQKLPKEIRDTIESVFIKSTLAPGCIFPDQAPDLNGTHFFFGEHFEQTKYEVLLGLNRANYLLHGVQFWSNLFVIGNGPAYQSMRWLRRMHTDVQARIRKVYISLSKDDEPQRPGTSVEYIPWASYHEGAVYDPLQLMHNFDNQTHNFNVSLMWTWREKLLCLEHLELENLIIDVRDAFDFDGRLLGEEFMRVRLRYTKKPQNVKIIASNDALAATLLSVLGLECSVKFNDKTTEALKTSTRLTTTGT